MSISSDESFLARWSRLKRKPDATGANEVRVDQQSLPAHDGSQAQPMQSEPMPSPAAGPSGASQRCSQGEEAESADESAPADGNPQIELRDFSEFDFEKLDFNSDYTQFMKDGVPEEARTRALRQLWISNPVLANMDGLDDYCEDYTDAAMVPAGGVRTAYRIGKGFLSDADVAEWEALGRPDDPEVVAVGSVADRAEQSEGATSPSGEVGAEEMGAAGKQATGLGQATARDDGSPADAGALIDSAGGAGAACAALLKQEEQAALDAYDDNVSKIAENGAGGAKKLGSRPDHSAGKDQSET